MGFIAILFFIFRDFSAKESVPVLQHMIANGNTTTFHYRHGKEPSSVEEVTLNFAIDDEDVVDDSKADEV